jgi:hypothetical protein
MLLVQENHLNMKWYIKRLISFLPEGTQRKFYENDFRKEYEKWEKTKGFPVPHFVKQKTIIHYQELYKINTLVETGTYLGDMIYIMEPRFSQLYTIELSQQLYERAQKRFAGKNKVKLLQGDSGEQINKVVSELKGPAIFWLDGHYSEGITAKGDLHTPIVQELKTIFKSAFPNVILIDDARLFVGKNDYPTIDTVTLLTEQFTTGRYTVKNDNDIIQIIPNQ